MKKILLFVLSMTLILASFAGCGSGTGGNSGSGKNALIGIWWDGDDKFLDFRSDGTGLDIYWDAWDTYGEVLEFTYTKTDNALIITEDRGDGLESKNATISGDNISNMHIIVNEILDNTTYQYFSDSTLTKDDIVGITIDDVQIRYKDYQYIRNLSFGADNIVTGTGDADFGQCGSWELNGDRFEISIESEDGRITMYLAMNKQFDKAMWFYQKELPENRGVTWGDFYERKITDLKASE